MKCQRCQKPAVISTSNGTFCADHFKENFERITVSTIKKYGLISPGETIAVANSGGKDSLSLLYVLSKRYSKTNKIVSITIDEGIKGYRDKTIEIMKKHTEAMNVEYRIFSYKDFAGKEMDEIIKVKKGIPCATCGVLRRYLLNLAAFEVHADKIATAHNLDDEAESAVMNLIQNDFDKLLRSGPVSGLGPKNGFVPRIKPFIFISEKETMLFSMLNGMDAVHSPCPYAGFGFRGVVSRKIKEMESFKAGSKRSIVEKAMKIKASRSALEPEKSAQKCRICGFPSAGDICDFCKIKAELGKAESSPVS